MKTLTRSLSLVASALIVCPTASSTLLYDAGLGTLPEQQGFDFVSTGSEATPSVSVGSLAVKTVSDPSYQYWTTTSEVRDFSSATAYGANVEVQILKSTYVTTPRIRAGYQLGIEDSSGRYFALQLGENVINLIERR